MPHLEPDRLALLALGDDDDSGHLSECAACRTEFEKLQLVASIGCQTQEVRDLPPPPEHIWAAVEAAVAPAARSRWRARALVLAAAVVAVLGLGAWLVLGNSSPPPVTQATLDRYGTAPAGARGDARVVDGTELRVHVSGMPLRPGYYEVWLLDPDSGRMVAVGTMGTGPDATMPVPGNIDLRVYRTVDVSAEDYDGNPEHSGRSMLRGTLTR